MFNNEYVPVIYCYMIIYHKTWWLKMTIDTVLLFLMVLDVSWAQLAILAQGLFCSSSQMMAGAGVISKPSLLHICVSVLVAC